MPFQEVVEAEGHLIDSHIMENIFDKVVEYDGRFEVQQFRIGITNSEPSYLRLRIETPDEESLERLISNLLELGCAPVDTGDAALKAVERDKCAPEDFYSLLWQIAYAELFISNVLWPDFGRRELYEAVLAFQGRERRFGRVSA